MDTEPYMGWFVCPYIHEPEGAPCGYRGDTTWHRDNESNTEYAFCPECGAEVEVPL